MLSRVADASQYDARRFPLLTAAALADQHSRPTDLRVLSSAPVTGFGDAEVQRRPLGRLLRRLALAVLLERLPEQPADVEQAAVVLVA